MTDLSGWQILLIALVGALPPTLAAIAGLIIAVRDLRATRRVSGQVEVVRKQVNGGMVGVDQVDRLVRDTLSLASFKAITHQVGREIRVHLSADLREMVQKLLAELGPGPHPSAKPTPGETDERDGD